MSKFFIEQFKTKNDTALITMAENYLVKKSLLQDLTTKFQAKMELKADEDLKKPTVVLGFRTEHAVLAGSQTSGQNTKATKGKGKKTSTEQNSDNSVEISFIDKVSLVKDLKSMINELDDELVEPLVEHLLK